MSASQYLTVSQVAELLQLHPERVRVLTRQGKLPGQRVGNKGAWRFEEEAVRRVLKQRSSV